MSLSQEVNTIYRQFLIYRAQRSMQQLDAKDARYNELVNAMLRPVIYTAHASIGVHFDESAATEKFFEMLALPDGECEPDKFFAYVQRAIRNDFRDKNTREQRYRRFGAGQAESLKASEDDSAEHNEKLAPAEERLAGAILRTLYGQGEKVTRTMVLRFEGKSYEEIATIFGDNVPAVQMRGSRFHERVLHQYAVDQGLEDMGEARKQLDADIWIVTDGNVSIMQMLLKHGYSAQQFLSNEVVHQR